MNDEESAIKILSVLVGPGTTSSDVRGVVFYRLPEDQIPRDEVASIMRGIAGLFRDSVLIVGVAPGKESGTYWVGLNHITWGLAFEQALKALKVRGVSKKLRLPEGVGKTPNPDLKRVITPGPAPTPDPEPRAPRQSALDMLATVKGSLRLPRRRGRS